MHGFLHCQQPHQARLALKPRNSLTYHTAAKTQPLLNDAKENHGDKFCMKYKEVA